MKTLTRKHLTRVVTLHDVARSVAKSMNKYLATLPEEERKNRMGHLDKIVEEVKKEWKIEDRRKTWI